MTEEDSSKSGSSRGVRSNGDPAGIDVTVIGGGIAGITSALASAVEGYQVQLVTAERADHVDPYEASSSFGTPIGGGNVEPIEQDGQELLELFDYALAFYRELHEQTGHVSRRQFFLLGESGSVPTLPYQDQLHDYWERPLEDLSGSVPRTDAVPNDATVARFDAYGADNSLLADLYAAAEYLGVTIREERLDLPSAARNCPGIVVNCAGLYGPRVHGTRVDEEMTPVKGHLLHVEGVPAERLPDVEYAVLLEDTNSPVGEAYSFVRHTEQGQPKLVLGGSKIEGEWDNEDGWSFPTSYPMTRVDGREIPARIVETNTEIWEAFAGISPIDYDCTVVSGWRPKRDRGPKYGQVHEFDDSVVIDNYGWGAVGWTLAPGAARVVVDAIQGQGVEPTNEPPSVGGSPCAEAVRTVLTIRGGSQ